ncbi:hypothetical protein SDC9_07467 [bioreactor metagenome]|uniref:Uncharacterized protein n=1 Tax=bioreactor metagenome TaxID=1076179 RepID=A0A644T4L7_9ZZZZ|nr:hypothetical protein [Methanobrevibacter sp.]MEA4956923.1 hypothetical protein [Methanobrevibacter sp.]
MKGKITKVDIIKSEVICPNCESNKYLIPYSANNEEGKYVMCKKCWVYYNYNDLKQYEKV